MGVGRKAPYPPLGINLPWDLPEDELRHRLADSYRIVRKGLTRKAGKPPRSNAPSTDRGELRGGELLRGQLGRLGVTIYGPALRTRRQDSKCHRAADLPGLALTDTIPGIAFSGISIPGARLAQHVRSVAGDLFRMTRARLAVLPTGDDGPPEMMARANSDPVRCRTWRRKRSPHPPTEPREYASHGDGPSSMSRFGISTLRHRLPARYQSGSQELPSRPWRHILSFCACLLRIGHTQV